MRASLAAALQLPLALSPPAAATATAALSNPTHGYGKTCIVPPGPSGSDAAPAIVQAFRDCGHNDDARRRGTVVFLAGQTYTVRTAMNTTGLRHVDIDHRGVLRWDANIAYWLRASLPVGYQNQSSAWLFGGEGVRWDGHGRGTLDGNGQVWYDFVNGTNNYPGRPHQITITGTRDSVFRGLRFVQSQMW